jgi:short-subunit dehydrogenase
MTYTLLTGASSGIGFELAHVFARHQRNLILVARSEDKMLALKKELTEKYKIDVQVLGSDLAKFDSSRKLFDIVQSKKWDVDCLVNNAGFGDHGPFIDSNPQKITEMVQLNIATLTDLTRLFLPSMLKNKTGQILNVASTASFQPGPLMTVYYATKAYVLHFSEGLYEELKNTGISVTALCPGPTDSGFQKVANISDIALMRFLRVPSSRDVAEYGYRAMEKGSVVAIHGFLNHFLASTIGFLPRALARKMVMRLQQKRFPNTTT